MLITYIKTTFRNLSKKKTYGFLNITGLAIGITCAAFILLWVQSELTYNHNFKKRNQIYQIMNNQTYDGTTYTFMATPGPLSAALKNEIPEFVRTTRMDWGTNALFSVGEKAIYVRGNYADSSIFDMLDLPVKKGNLKDVFRDPSALVISETMALNFFDEENPIGQRLLLNNDKAFIVKAVIADLPENSSFQFQWLAPYHVYESNNKWLENWGNNGTQTFVELAPSANTDDLNKKLKGFIQTKMEGAISQLFVFNMTKWRLYSNFTNGKEDGGRIKYIRLFTIIAWIILIIACINFMNLATARSEQRAREVGVRKVLGARKKALIGQFISESLVLAFIAVTISVLLIVTLLPYFNQLVEKQLSFSLSSPTHLGGLLAIGLVCGLLAGSYPAFYLSSFKPIVVLKGLKIGRNNSNIYTRKGLVVLQFSISVILIISTVIIYLQIQHVKSRELGYNKNNLIYLSAKGKIKEHFEAIKTQLINTGKITNATLSSSQIVQLGSNSADYSWQGKDPAKQLLITQEYVTPEYVNTIGMKLIAGRDFRATGSADSNNIIINKSLASLISDKDVIGKIITRNGGDKYTIIGIVNDFIYNDMYAKSAPVILFNYKPNASTLNIRFKDGSDIKDALAATEKVLKQVNPVYPFEYKFVDETFDKQFKTETLTGKLASLFALLAILISCLGLFGLAAYTAERRTKEIGIRKVLGASVTGLTALLSKDFLLLVIISCLIAFPLSWWCMNDWLQGFAYRINIEWWVFATSGLLAMAIALVTVSVQAIRAALANPVNSLRTE
jgi:putative ABC transport system permease protein